ncbi:flavin reductase family protein [Thalassotalea maritima]|uniref:flavin reductase family protein n=1 Tax=Thalassotalea maritima TaxID=3242416 RepID=UPI003527A1E8
MAANSFDTRAFRNALGSFATGVTIITTKAGDGQLVGLTANSFNSVSLEPPLVLWSLAKTAASVPVFNDAEHWNVHILSVEQEPLSNKFASKGADKFADVELEHGITDAPLLAGCTARLQCRNAFQYDGGDHIIFVGEVLAFDTTDSAPLAFVGGQYALTARKPYEGVALSSSTVEELSSAAYNENLLGYLLGRSHFQLLHGLKDRAGEKQLSDLEFYVLSVLGVQSELTLAELNEYLRYTDIELSMDDLGNLFARQLIALGEDGALIQLTHDGRQESISHIATAKGLEESIKETLGEGELQALKLLLKKVIKLTDPGVPDLWDVAKAVNQ